MSPLRRKIMWYMPAAVVAAGIAFVSLWENPHTPFSVHVNDKLIHALMYAVLTLTLLLPQIRKPRSAWRVYLLAALAAFLYGCAMEVLQACCTVTRAAEWADVLADGIGVILTIMVVGGIKNRRSGEE